MATDPPMDPGLQAYWEAIDIATEQRDALFRTAINEYERAIADAKRMYLAYQENRNTLRQSARDGAGQKGGQ